ncbi:syntaxin-41-like [Iris pallida]|uniref:Syntaxin-41-like n=1 Tax=Iris pallida TaxID=29817 RepID=A0AAX6FCU1_IRIPA|nr:syntaxin-41-like [Iris pallida]
MATRYRNPVYRKYRDALCSVRVPSAPSPPSHSGPSTSSSIEMSGTTSTSLLRPNRSYAPLSTEDPGSSSRSDS